MNHLFKDEKILKKYLKIRNKIVNQCRMINTLELK